VLTKVPGGEAPQWPEASGPRVFVYLKDADSVQAVLAASARTGYATVAYVDRASTELRRQFESSSVHLAAKPVDLRRAAAECDAAVLGGGHGATAEMLLAGKPLLQIPVAREQRMVAEAVKRLGAGEMTQGGSAERVRAALDAVLSDASYAQAARTFADRYAAFDPQRQRAAMLERAEELLSVGREVADAGVDAA